MKTLLKAVFLLNILFLFNCKSQTIATNDYIAFYNDIVPKLNSLVPNKTQFYGQNFSNFYNELQNKNLDVIMIDYDSKTDPGTKYYVLRLFFSLTDMWSFANKNDYQYPWISITFQDEIPPQIKTMVEQSNSQWTYNMIQFFANMKIEKIKFVGVRGYDNDDYSGK